MNQGELVQYLKEVSDLEAQLYTYRKIEHIYQKELRILEREKNSIYFKDGTETIPENRRRRNFVIPSPEAKVNYLGERRDSLGRKMSTFGFQGTYDMFKDIPERWWDDNLRRIEREERNKYKGIHLAVLIAALFAGSLLAWFLRNVIPLFIAVIVGVIACYMIGNETNKEYLPGNPYFEKFMYFYEQKYDEELQEKARFYNPRMEFVSKEYETQVLPYITKVENLLKKSYTKKVLRTEYKNFIAVAQLYDYFRTGRCTSLEEAYALFETEIKAGTIITDFDISVYQLDKYSAVMPTMVAHIKRINHVTNNILKQVKEGEKNTALAEFTAQCKF